MFATSIKGALGALALGAAALMTSAPTASAQGADPILGQISPVGFNFCPRGWAAADGQLLPISSNSALFSLFGTIYGGDGRTTFALPDLRGRAPVHRGMGPGLSDVRQGARYGAETTVLTTAQMPAHNHLINVTNEDATKHGPGNDFLAVSYYQDGTNLNLYSETANRQMDPNAVTNTGSGQNFGIVAPRLAINFCVALEGIFPSRN